METKRVDLKVVGDLIFDESNLLLTGEEMGVSKEILNTLNKNAESISSPCKILDFCKKALKYNPVSEFI